MPRHRHPERFADLVNAATVVFATSGFRRAQIDEIAQRMGVAKGTVYLYAASKEALFQLVLDHADGPPPVEPALLPVPTPAPGATGAWLDQRLAERGRFPRLAAALTGPGPDPAAELHGVVAEVFDTLAANAVAIRLVNAAAPDLPELADTWYQRARTPLVDGLTTLLISRPLAPQPDPAVAARMVIETCMWFAVHRRWDPRPSSFTPAAVRETILVGLTRALGVPSPGS